MSLIPVEKWYAMSAPYGREMYAVGQLKDEPGVETYVPMEKYERMVGRKKQERKISERPIIRNLLFVKASEERMRALKAKYNTLIQFKMRRMGDGYTPIIVPTKDMEAFIAITTHKEDAKELIYFKPEEIEQLGLRPDAKVRIADGIFEGKEGYYQRIKGKRSKRFVVRIDDFLACAAVLAECKYIKIDSKRK